MSTDLPIDTMSTCFDTEHWPVHPGGPLIDDDSAVAAEQAIVELTLRRSPASLGDCLADLHAIASLLAQLRRWIPASVDGARHQGHSWSAIAAQLAVTPTAARRRHRACDPVA
jgi:hypothetical protein